MLNKNGWGYREFLIGGAILLIALLFAAFFIIRLYSGLPNLNTFIVDPVDYQDIENSVKTASLKYISNYYREDIGDAVIVISTDNLKKYDLIKASYSKEEIKDIYIKIKNDYEKEKELDNSGKVYVKNNSIY